MRVFLSGVVFASIAAALPSQEPAADAADPIAALVPSVDSAVFRFSSLDEAGTLLGELAEAFGQEFDLEEWLRRSPAVCEWVPEIARDRPLAVSWPVPSLRMRVHKTFVLPSRGQPRAASFRSSQVRVQAHDSYVAVSMNPDYEAPQSPNPLALGLDPAPVSGRILLPPYLLLLQPFLGPALDLAAAQNPALVKAGYLEAVQRFASDARALDFALDRDGALVHLAAAVRLEAESTLLAAGEPPSASASGMARHLLAGEMMHLLQTGRLLEAYSDMILSLNSGMVPLLAENDQQHLLAFLDRSLELARRQGPEVAFSGTVGRGSMQFAAYCRPDDPAGFVQMARTMYEQAATTGIGLGTVAAAGDSVLAGVTVHRFQMELDLDLMAAAMEQQSAGSSFDVDAFCRAIYGDGRVQIAIAAKDGVVLVAQHTGDEFLPRAVAGLDGQTPDFGPGMSRALALTQGRPRRLVMAMDLAGLMSLVDPLMPVPVFAGGDATPVPIAFYAWPEAESWRGGVLFPQHDMGHWAQGVMARVQAAVGASAQPQDGEEEF